MSIKNLLAKNSVGLEAQKQRILDGLAVRRERILFGLELPEEPKRRGRPPGGGERRAKEIGDQVCPICRKGGLTERGLKTHMTRMHKGEEVGSVREGKTSG